MELAKPVPHNPVQVYIIVVMSLEYCLGLIQLRDTAHLVFMRYLLCSYTNGFTTRCLHMILT